VASRWTIAILCLAACRTLTDHSLASTTQTWALIIRSTAKHSQDLHHARLTLSRWSSTVTGWRSRCERSVRPTCPFGRPGAAPPAKVHAGFRRERSLYCPCTGKSGCSRSGGCAPELTRRGHLPSRSCAPGALLSPTQCRNWSSSGRSSVEWYGFSTTRLATCPPLGRRRATKKARPSVCWTARWPISQIGLAWAKTLPVGFSPELAARCSLLFEHGAGMPPVADRPPTGSACPGFSPPRPVRSDSPVRDPQLSTIFSSRTISKAVFTLQFSRVPTVEPRRQKAQQSGWIAGAHHGLSAPEFLPKHHVLRLATVQLGSG